MIHYLGIGNNFPGTSSELAGCVNDVRDIAAIFKPYCATTKTIINSKADRDGVYKEGRIFLDRLKKGDLGILWISGHGTRERGSNGYNEGVVTADMEIIWDYEMNGLLRKRARGSVLVVGADVCHAGGLPRGWSKGRSRPAKEGKRPKAIPISLCRRHKYEGPQRIRALPDVIGYLACLATQVAYDAWFDGRANGAMTEHVKQSVALQPGETFGKIFKKLSKLLPNEEYDQEPQVSASAANLRRTLKSFAKAT